MALVTEGERCGIMVEEEKVMACEAVNEDSEASTGMDGGGVGDKWMVCLWLSVMGCHNHLHYIH